MRQRPSARLLVLDADNRVLLFRFAFKHGALAGKDFWATPGGAVAEDETFEDAAKRELKEETGIQINGVDEHVAERQFVMPMPTGEHVIAQEKFFVVRVHDSSLGQCDYTPEETEVMVDHKWWNVQELQTTSETFFPEDLADILLKST